MVNKDCLDKLERLEKSYQKEIEELNKKNQIDMIKLHNRLQLIKAQADVNFL